MMHLLYYLLKALKHHFLFEVKYKAKDQKCNINRKINLLTTIMGSVWTEKDRTKYVRGANEKYCAARRAAYISTT